MACVMVLLDRKSLIVNMTDEETQLEQPSAGLRRELFSDVKAVLERGMDAERTSHLGYERGDPGGNGSGNSRNGTTPKRWEPRSATSGWTSRGIGAQRSPPSWE